MTAADLEGSNGHTRYRQLLRPLLLIGLKITGDCLTPNT